VSAAGFIAVAVVASVFALRSNLILFE